MPEYALPAHILSIDDDPDIRDLIELTVAGAGYGVESAPDGAAGLARARANPPALILLDVMMPHMDGYEVCRQLQADCELSAIPVVFLTALGEEHDKAKAFALGAVDYMTKPFRPAELIDVIRMHLLTAVRWQELTCAELDWTERLAPSDFVAFREHLLARVGGDTGMRELITTMRSEEMYAVGQKTGVSQPEMGQMLADFLKVPRVTAIDPKDIDLGALPTPFCRKNLVVPIREGESHGLVVANPFNWELLETIRNFSGGRNLNLSIAEPRVIMALLTGAQEAEEESSEPGDAEPVHSFSDPSMGTANLRKAAEDAEIDTTDTGPVTYIANNMIVAAVQQKASDIHIEPKENNTVVRFRVDGDLRDFVTLKRTTAAMLISRLKALAGLDIAERRKPQDGSLEADVAGGRYKLRLATTSTPEGESLIMRLLEVTAEAKPLTELGLTENQSDQLHGFAQRSNGLILIVGMTGSGKTTTIYSLISSIDGRRRSVLTIEDPVEYRITFANQQQVNEKAGVTFESLLRSVVRQDPDVLFLGEIRDTYSARMAMDFASTGHLTITTLHTTNATTAVFRLERLGVTRDVMGEALLCIIAQRLIKRLCPHCRSVDPITEEERAWLAPFTSDVPEQVAHPVGCIACSGTGYAGREAVDEVIDFDPEIQEMVRSGAPVSEIRSFQRKRGDYLMYDHAIEKVRAFTFSPADVFERILTEELAAMQSDSARAATTAAADAVWHIDAPELPATPRPAPRSPAVSGGPASEPASVRAIAARILLAEDDEDARAYVRRMLERAGYDVTCAIDGGAALVALGGSHFDLIIADVQMPTLDGFALLEVVSQQPIPTPVIMLTGSDTPEDEARGLALGAADFIHKPVRQDVLLARVQRVISNSDRRQRAM
ncbi:MAG: ATPase, T2SS/T4P/T4SS family [Coriobacteriia bacterium]|nr:ATPase, T2SS/T4P/T4SS family [Coriobacteriia bacterium]